MMRLNVVDDYRKLVVVDADTIDTLKARIVECFSLKEDDLNERLLVRDGRYIPVTGFVTPMVNGSDLLELEEGSILEDHLCNDCLDHGNTLLLGWKGPFIISFVSPAHSLHLALHDSFNFEVDPYDTLGELKLKIESASGERATEENLPTIFFEWDDNKPLIFFGFYKYWKGLRGGDKKVQFYINRNRDNRLVLWESLPSLCKYRTEPETPCYFGNRNGIEEDLKKLKVGIMDEYGDRILVPLNDSYETPKKKLKENKGTEGDKNDAGPSYSEYQPSKKEMKNINIVIYSKTKQRKKKRIRRNKRIGRNCIMRTCRTPMESRVRSRGRSVPSRARPGCSMR